jgi:hypothetical protein
LDYANPGITTAQADAKFVNALVHINGMDAMILRQIMNAKRMFDYVYDTDKWFRPILRNRHLLTTEEGDSEPVPVVPPVVPEPVNEYTPTSVPVNVTTPPVVPSADTVTEHPIDKLPDLAFHNPIHTVPAINDGIDYSTKIEEAFSSLGLTDIDHFYGQPGGSILERENHTQEGLIEGTITQKTVSFDYCEVNCDKLIEPFRTECKRMRVGRYNYIKNLHNGAIPQFYVDCHELSAAQREKNRIVFIDKAVIDKPGDPVDTIYAAHWVGDRSLNLKP